MDPLAAKNWDWSPYNHCGDNPLAPIDADGMDWFYYQAQGENEASYHWHDGNIIYTKNQNGNIGYLTDTKETNL